MLELPEAQTVARQICETLIEKQIMNVITEYSPHKFAWFHGDPGNYPTLLKGKRIEGAKGHGGMVEISAGSATLLFGDGVGLRYHSPGESRPAKHQLLVEFDDTSALSASVQMYGGLWAFANGDFDDPYYKVAKEKTPPLSDDFDWAYFDGLISAPEYQKLSAKAFLATEQRIPGLGNGVLQDILWNAKIHPKRKINSLSSEDRERLFAAVKTTLSEMTRLGGRDTEKDLFGNAGGYKTAMSKNNVGYPCPSCGGFVQKMNYLGGSVYFCEGCQPL